MFFRNSFGVKFRKMHIGRKPFGAIRPFPS